MVTFSGYVNAVAGAGTYAGVDQTTPLGTFLGATGTGAAVSVPVGEAVLGRVGRMKYLKPLFTALHARPETKPVAKRLFEQNQARLHPIARQVISGLLAK